MKLIHFTNFFPYPRLFLKFSLLIVGRCKKHHILELILSNVMKIYCFLYNILLLLSIKVKESGFYLHFYRLLSPILALGGQKVSSHLILYYSTPTKNPLFFFTKKSIRGCYSFLYFIVRNMERSILKYFAFNLDRSLTYNHNSAGIEVSTVILPCPFLLCPRTRSR